MPKEREDDATILRRYGIEPDLVIEAYKKDVDRTLPRQSRRRTVPERMDNLAALQDFMAKLRRGAAAAQRRGASQGPGSHRGTGSAARRKGKRRVDSAAMEIGPLRERTTKLQSRLEVLRGHL
jgi:hypothetical protein